MTLKRYRKKEGLYVIAIQLDLDFDYFKYKKWDGIQTCKRNDWIINNSGDIYTVDNNVFQRTYKNIGLGIYTKTTNIWAKQTTKKGKIKTKEGESVYFPGDYIIFNDESGSDSYCISKKKFNELYEPDE